MKYLKLIVCSALIIFSTQIFGNADLEQLTRRSATQGYDQHFVDLIELVYGTDFLSLGGKESVEQMVSGLDLDGRTILDIGSGLGGPALYLAGQYNVNVIGIDPQNWIIDEANRRLEKSKADLKGSARFVLTENPSHLKQFPDAAFDIVFSKEAILHIP